MTQHTKFKRKQILIAAWILLFSISLSGTAFSEGEDGGGGGGNAMISQDTGVAVNGSANDSSINNNQNTMTNGNNTNTNLIAPTSVNLSDTRVNPVLYSPTQGGNSVMVMPRNPLPLPNAALGRSNFGFQFGAQNFPGMGGLTGNGNALGWFMQGGVTIPFGKIPDAFNTAKNSRLDDIRQDSQDRERMVFGNLQPRGQNTNQVKTDVQGKVMGLGAYNLSTLPASKINLPGQSPESLIGEIKLPQPKVLALEPADVYTKPLNTGEKIGAIDVGNEYPYLGHTRSGWVKLLLPNGMEGWTSTHFEYIKNDFTEVDSLAVDPQVAGREKTAKLPDKNQKGERPVVR